MIPDREDSPYHEIFIMFKVEPLFIRANFFGFNVMTINL